MSNEADVRKEEGAELHLLVVGVYGQDTQGDTGKDHRSREPHPAVPSTVRHVPVEHLERDTDTKHRSR